MKIECILAILGIAITLHYGVDAAALSSSEAQTCLNSHNKLRQLHYDTPNMVWDNKLAADAQSYAEELVRKNQGGPFYMEHEKPDKGYGENIYWGDNPDVPVCAMASLAWYNEIKDYNYNTASSKNGNAIGHFTQLVWKDSVRLGVGIASMTSRKDSRNKETFIVAKYSPRGNFYYYGNKYNDYTKNVARQKSGAVVPSIEELDPSLKLPCTNANGDDWCNYFLVQNKGSYQCTKRGYEDTFRKGCYQMCGYC